MNYYITYFEIAAFLASLTAWGKIKRNKYLRLFPVLLLIIISVEGYETFIQTSGNINNTWLYNIEVPLQYLVYLAILYYAINNKQVRKIIIAASVIFIFVTIITGVYFTRQGVFNGWSYSIGSIILIVFILIKFHEMLQNPADFNFINNPFFYMLFAFLVFKVGSLPYFVMANWLYFQKGDINTIRLLQAVMSILNYILYSVYTIAFIWMRMKVSG